MPSSENPDRAGPGSSRRARRRDPGWMPEEGLEPPTSSPSLSPRARRRGEDVASWSDVDRLAAGDDDRAGHVRRDLDLEMQLVALASPGAGDGAAHGSVDHAGPL